MTSSMAELNCTTITHRHEHASVSAAGAQRAQSTNDDNKHANSDEDGRKPLKARVVLRVIVQINSSDVSQTGIAGIYII